MQHDQIDAFSDVFSHRYIKSLELLRNGEHHDQDSHSNASISDQQTSSTTEDTTEQTRGTDQKKES